MSRYRNIHCMIWNDDKFQELWAKRWETPSRVPTSYNDPYWRLFGSPYGSEQWERERNCLVLRHRFSKIKKRIYPSIVNKFGQKCAACGSTKGLVLDHVIPICYGGTNDEFNFQPLCMKCNTRKGGKLPIPPGVVR